MTLIEKPSQLPVAIGQALKSAFPQLRVGNHQDFVGTGDKTGVLISVERNGPNVRSLKDARHTPCPFHSGSRLPAALLLLTPATWPAN
jgi:hypothetical protein